MLALVDGVPRTLSLDAFIRHWVNHQLDVIARRTAYLKREAEERDHILQGYLKALDMLDEVIALIRASEDTDTARGRALWGCWTSTRCRRTLSWPCSCTLTRMNRDKIVAEHEELQRKIADYIDIPRQAGTPAQDHRRRARRDSSPSTATTAAPRSCRSPAR